MSDTRYLRVSGRLGSDNRLILRPGYLSENPRDSADIKDSPLKIELHGAEGLLLRWGALLAEPALDRIRGRGPASYRIVRAKVPYNPATTRILYRLGDALLLETHVPKRGPELKARSVRAVKKGETLALQWEAAHPDGVPLHYHVGYTSDGGKNWVRLAWHLTTPRLSVPLEQIAGGKGCRIQVTAYDGVNTVSAIVPFPGAPESRVTARIISPAPSKDPLSVSPVQLDAMVGVPGGLGAIKEARYEWTVDGDLISQERAALWHWTKPGRHKISLRVSHGRLSAEDSMLVLTR